MKRFNKWLLANIFLYVCLATNYAQTSTIQRDATIFEMIEQISSSNLENNIRKMVSFDTRHTFKDEEDKEKE